MITIQVLFLGPSKDFTGSESITLELPDQTNIADLRHHLVERFPELSKALSAIRFAINESFVLDDATLQHDDEVALIPPVSGGSGGRETYIDLVKEAIPVDRVRGFITGDPHLGGMVTFEGATRMENDAIHGNLIRLDYEAYESMACKELQNLVDEVKTRWSAGRVAIVHRLGPVPPGEVSVMIAVACVHREHAFDACRWIIDTLKKNIPIWKKNVYEDGSVHWVETK